MKRSFIGFQECPSVSGLSSIRVGFEVGGEVRPNQRNPSNPGLLKRTTDHSTGLSIVGEGEWAAAKHGGKGKRGWKKLHLGVDASGVILAQVLTNGDVDDAVTGLRLIDEVGRDIASITASAQATEVVLACSILNRMTAIGRSASFAVES